VISDGAVSLPDGLLELRELAGDLNVSLESGRPSAGHGTLTAKGLTVAGTPFDQAQAEFDMSSQRAELTASLGSDDSSGSSCTRRSATTPPYGSSAGRPSPTAARVGSRSRRLANFPTCPKSQPALGRCAAG
jgi:hypothetical protein